MSNILMRIKNIDNDVYLNAGDIFNWLETQGVSPLAEVVKGWINATSNAVINDQTKDK